MLLLDILDIVILSGLGLFFIIQLFYYWFVFAKPYRHVKKIKSGEIILPYNKPPVSIIVYVRNEYYSLKYLLPALLEQDYPEFEIIIINDGISDENEELVSRLKSQHNNLHTTNLPEGTKNISRKKLGITLGIKGAKYETLLFTEPDSVPRTNLWIASMSRNFQNKKTIVLGISIKKESSGLASLFIGYDYLFSQIQFLSLALLGHPYAANGRNLAYEKTLFNQGKGFSKYRFLKQGDDDLFINDMATQENTAVELTPKCVVDTWISNWTDYKFLKKDTAITKSFYKGISSFFWSMELLSRVGFFLFFCACFIVGLNQLILPAAALFCFSIRIFSQLFVINKTSNCWNGEHFYFSILLFDFIQPFINAYFFLYRVFRKKENYTTKL